jgi:hypothetical protein
MENTKRKEPGFFATLLVVLRWLIGLKPRDQ